MIGLVLNGEEVRLGDGATAADAVAASGAPAPYQGIAVAVDGEVVPRGAWNATELHDGAQVEVLQAVQGG